MNQKVDLKVDFCSHEAAKWAVEHWHYSKAMPAGKLIKIGVWESDLFVGCVIFGRGAIYNIGSPYELTQMQVCELVRVALAKHESLTSAIVSRSLRLLKIHNPGLRLVVSYADSKQGHLGTIYQAMNWLYCDAIVDRLYSMFGQQLRHGRTLYSRYGTQSIDWLKANVDPKAAIEYQPPKHKYLYPLDRAMRKQIEPLAKPYPKRDNVRLAEGSTPATSQGRRFDPDQAALTARDPIRLSE